MTFFGFLILALFNFTIALFVTFQIRSYLNSPLKRIPGPFLAKFTNLWRLFDTWGGRLELTHQLLHEKYGTAVRIGPDLVSLSDPTLLRTIYDSRGTFLKTEMYAVSDSKVGRQRIANLFNTRNNAWHSEKRSLIAPLFKMSHLMEYESLIDDTIASFCKHLDERFINHPNNGKACEMSDWLFFFAWDVLAQLTLSRPMGFMDSGSDTSGFLSTAEKALDYFAPISQMPWLDELLVKNPIIRIGPPAFDNTANFCIQQCIARQQGTDGKSPGLNDMLDDLLALKVNEPERMNDNDVVGFLLLNIVAGSDTTGILLRAIVYYVLKNPHVHKKLQQELDDAHLSIPVSYAAASKLPYLDAVIREAWRIHPSVGMMLERVVPAGGLQLRDGTVLSPGTKVGMNAWVIHHDKNVFGQYAASFSPGRWLRDVEGESEEEWHERVANMKRHDLTFGAGKRVCIGKDMALLETYKVVATLFWTYNMTLVDPEKEWHLQNSWFIRQSGIDIKLERRL